MPKASNKLRYYAVRIGRVPGVYDSWMACREHVNGVTGAIFKSFPNRHDAENFAFDTSDERIEFDVATAIRTDECIANQSTGVTLPAHDTEVAQGLAPVVWHCWLGWSTRRPGCVGTWYGDGDRKNKVHKFDTGGPLTVSSLGLCAFAKCISAAVIHNRMAPEADAVHQLYIHCPTAYLVQAILATKRIRSDSNMTFQQKMLHAHVRSMAGSCAMIPVTDAAGSPSYLNYAHARRLCEPELEPENICKEQHIELCLE